MLCELVNPDDEEGGIASRDACFAFAKKHNLKVTTIEMLKKWREQREGSLPANGSSGQFDQERGVKLPGQQIVGPSSNAASS